MNASDVLVERMMEWGVDTIFGLPGDGINGVFEALHKQKDKIRFIPARQAVQIDDAECNLNLW